MEKKEQRSRIHYIHRISYSYRERLVGLFILIALGIIVALVIGRGKASNLFEEKVYYHAYLHNAQGVSTDSKITISGIEVGNVQSLDITQDNRIHVRFHVYKKYQSLLRNDSTGALSKLSLLGNVLMSNTILNIKAGSPDQPIMEDGSTIPFEEPKTLDGLITEFTPLMDNIKRTIEDLSEVIASIDPAEIERLTSDLAESMTDIRDATGQIKKGKGSIGQLIYNNELEQDINQTIENIRHTTDHIASGKGTIGKILYDKELENDVDHILALLNVMLIEAERRVKELKKVINNSISITEGLKNSTDILGDEMVELPELINRLKFLMESTDETLQGIKRVWPLSTAISDNEETVDAEDKPKYD